jgi:hypothetical protein
MNLPMFDKDKANHAIYGVVIYGLSSILITPVFSLIAVFITAVAKELYDNYNGKRFSYGDIMATQAGGIIGFLISIIN